MTVLVDIGALQVLARGHQIRNGISFCSIEIPSETQTHGFADTGVIRLHYVEAGTGPLVVLLHGYPEHWICWRHQIPALAAAGFRVVAPDLRGYNLSGRPRDYRAYDAEAVASDIAALIAERGAERATIVGHDWGAAVAWTLAMHHPERVDRLVILNVPHPRQVLRAMRNPRQIARSWYILAFQIPWLPERLVPLGRFWHRRRNLRRDPQAGAYGPEDVEAYLEAWRRPGAVPAMLGSYRASFRQRPAAIRARIRRIEAPTLVIWGERDRYLLAELATPDPVDVPNLHGVVRLPSASHWTPRDAPERVNELLVDFLQTPAANSS